MDSEQAAGYDEGPARGAEERAGSRALTISRDVRQASLRARRQRQILYLGIVAAAVVCALLWGLLVTAPRYEAEARFSVRGAGPSAPQQGSTSLLSSGTNGGASMGFVDGFAVNDFLKSRDCMLQLSKRIDLARLLSSGGVDPASSLPEHPTQEALYKAYSRAVSAQFNLVEQENVLSVSAFSPEGSQKIAAALVTLAEEFVQKMDEQGVRNTLDVDTRRLREAEAEAISAADAVAAWRSSNQNLDPEAESTMVMGVIGQLETELTTARINYEKVRAFGNPDHPMLQPAQAQVAGLEAQLARARQRLAGGSNSQANRLRTYSQLKNAQAFADSSLTAARDAYQQALRETTRLRRYVTLIARPVAGDQPASPNLALLALEGLLVGLLLAFIASLVLGTVRTGPRS